MPVPTFVATSAPNPYTNNTSSGPVVVNKPAGVVQDDLMIAYVVWTRAIGTFVTSLTSAPSGWTQLMLWDQGNGGNYGVSGFWIGIYYKLAGSSEPSSYTWSVNSNGQTISHTGAILAYRGVNPTTPIIGTNYTQRGPDNIFDSTIPAPSVTTAIADSRLVGFFHQYEPSGGSLASAPGSMTTRIDAGGVAYGYNFAAADEVRAAVGATGTRTGAGTSSDPKHTLGFLTVIQPANVAPTAPVVTAPNGGETIDASVNITWTAATDDYTAQASLRYHLQYTPDNGANWYDIIALTNAGVTSYNWNTAALASSAAYKVRARAWDGALFGPYDESNAVFTIQHNQAPTAPTWVTPTGGSTVDRTAAQIFDWNFNDPNAGDTQSRFDFEYRLQGATPWTVVSVGPGGAGLTSAHTLAAGALAAGTYEFRVRTYDQLGVVGSYSSTLTVTFGSPPAGPVFTSPLNGGVITGNEHVVTWTTTEQNEGYELRRVADNAGAPNASVIYWTHASASATDRNKVVPFETNNRYEHLQIRTKHNTLWSSWISIRVNVAYTAPPEPAILATAIPDENAMALKISNPTPSGGEPIVVSNDIWAREVGDQGEGYPIRLGAAVDELFIWRSFEHRTAYEFKVIAYSDTGAQRVSPWMAFQSDEEFEFLYPGQPV